MTTAVTRPYAVTVHIDADDTDEADDACEEATWGEMLDDPTPVESLAGYLHGMAYGARLFSPDDSVATRAHIDLL
ncbi:hypothetical protein AB0G86_18730 [Streptomyces scabiei]|uniref:hypothetical protein n=1 Tax=Streptomyces scabiei TaxID=1930 RepID=UPI0033DFFEA9